MTTNQFAGTGVAIITPFRDDLSVDYSALENQVERLIENGINYLVVLGTTAESVTLTEDEKHNVIETVIKKNNKRLPVVVGFGSNNTQALVNTIKSTNFDGIDAILSVAPYYNKPTQEGLYQHFKAVSEVSPVPVILYNVPGRTSSNIAPATAIRLANDFENVIAIKEATGSFAQGMELVQNKPKDFLVLSGEDGITLPLISVGFDGVISVVGNAFPKAFSDMVNLAREDKITEAREIHYKLVEIIDLLFVDGNPAGVKAALEIMKVCGNKVRLPLVPATEKTYKRLEELIKSF